MKNVNTISTSVSDQLINVATKNGENLDVFAHYYIQERWLYRLSISAYQERFLLKGDHLLFALTNGSIKRSTKIALSAKQMTDDINKLQHVFEEICAIEVPVDGVSFNLDELKITAKKEEVHIVIPVIFDQRKTYIEIQVSYRDNHILAPKTVTMPTLLDMESPKILGSSTETILAERFDAMIRLEDIENRMKDFYEVYLLLETQNIEGRVLQEAVLEVFDLRRTRIEKDQLVLSKEFYLNPQRNKQWNTFISDKSLTFEKTIKRLQKAFLPIYEVILTEDEFFGNWDCQLRDWK
ncbi:nucleotidyl transferase AbiEii/AbiGii toxin family protein [Lysinibacillus sp. NPDC096418]|uniref:nucleotidyl transferase AbiEii/AbiGii toxin family protein n=1 Tax=Lysinibacillus sp. NPDC096418 TaxID=3364138 RepID=UPI0038166191